MVVVVGIHADCGMDCGTDCVTDSGDGMLGLIQRALQAGSVSHRREVGTEAKAPVVTPGRQQPALNKITETTAKSKRENGTGQRK